jgi:hypothetical protein
VAGLLDALPPGSYLVATHITGDLLPPARARACRPLLGERVRCRDRAEFTALFDGLDLVAPGVVPAGQWRPALGAAPAAFDEVFWAAVGRKP